MKTKIDDCNSVEIDCETAKKKKQQYLTSGETKGNAANCGSREKKNHWTK